LGTRRFKLNASTKSSSAFYIKNVSCFLNHKKQFRFFSFHTHELTWFTHGDISDSISFYPNQIQFLSPTINEKFISIKMLIQSDISFDFSPTLFEFTKLTHLNTITISIFNLKFIDNLVWFNKTMQSYIRITSHHLTVRKIGKWYNFKKKNEIGITENFGLVKCGLSG
jgi:hypothetical protein